MPLLQTKIPPPVIAVCIAGLMWFVAGLDSVLVLPSAFHSQISVFLFVLALILAFFSVFHFFSVSTTLNPHKIEKTRILVTNGVYRYSRNPMYLALLLLLLSWGFYLGSLLSLILISVFVVLITRLQIEPEERALFKIFGQKYHAYRQKTRRWL